MTIETTIQEEFIEHEARVGCAVLDAMRRGLVDEYNVGGLPTEDLVQGLHLVNLLYAIRDSDHTHDPHEMIGAVA